MTISQMHIDFRLLYDETNSYSYPSLLPEEIDRYLNIAQQRIIEQRLYGNNVRREGAEESQKRVDDIRNLIKNYSTTTFVTNSDNKPNGVFVQLPSDYRHADQEDIIINYTDCTGTAATKQVEVVPLTHDRYNRTIKDPFNAPYEDLIYRLPYGKIGTNDFFELITDNLTSVNTYVLRYYKEPVSMQYGSTYSTPTTDVNCELAEHLHREIIEEGTKVALENVRSDRMQTTQALQNQTE